ncbi:hypothetical protein [Vibrio aestuarianus]|uniref:hypothetical protein n=1 Tax=Vibrio aestuarianus TaxID=28171 RepID=UPI00237C6D69|nr:hypothetical protein [Vibrio aestuarianus]MDE1331559.1 hypothetical protein [Vibrio aestuarianus]
MNNVLKSLFHSLIRRQDYFPIVLFCLSASRTTPKTTYHSRTVHQTNFTSTRKQLRAIQNQRYKMDVKAAQQAGKDVASITVPEGCDAIKEK